VIIFILSTVALCIVIFTPPEVGPRVTGARSLTLYLQSKENPLLAEGREQGEYEYLQKWTVALCIVIFTPPEVGPRVTGARSLTFTYTIQRESLFAEGREQGEYTNM
jgi:hypothetical protein